MRLWRHRLTRGSGSKLNSAEGRNRGTETGYLNKLRGVSVKQDVKVRAIDVIRSDVGGGRTAALAVADGALYPAKADLFPETRVNQRGPGDPAIIERTGFPVFMSCWKGNSDTNAGSVVAAIALESIACHGYPGRLIDTIPLRLCSDGRYWFVWGR